MDITDKYAQIFWSVAYHSGLNWWFSFAPICQWCCLTQYIVSVGFSSLICSIKGLSFGSKDYTKELKTVEFTSVLGQTS